MLDARRAIDAMRAELARRGVAAVILVADAHGDAILVERVDGASASSLTIAANKAWTAVSQGVASRSIGERVRGNERLDVAYYGDARICGWAGGLPVVVDGAIVGAIAVSGLPEDEDETVATIGLLALTR
jgi:glc operon protein GlcG